MSTSENPTIDIYRVAGMTCMHCAQSVTAELSSISGVSDVDVNLASGEVRVTSATPLDPDEVAAAIADAGYEIVT